MTICMNEIFDIIEKYYCDNEPLYNILITHSKQVCQRAVSIVDKRTELHLNRDFVFNAAMLHDIGIFMCNAPSINCFGQHQYVEHGYLGAELLRQEGLPQYALVAERHTGTGITKEQIIQENMPLPHRDFVPITLEEQLICYADNFYSKTHLDEEYSFEVACKKIQKFGEECKTKMIYWKQLFEP